MSKIPNVGCAQPVKSNPNFRPGWWGGKLVLLLASCRLGSRIPARQLVPAGQEVPCGSSEESTKICVHSKAFLLHSARLV